MVQIDGLSRPSSTPGRSRRSHSAETPLLNVHDTARGQVGRKFPRVVIGFLGFLLCIALASVARYQPRAVSAFQVLAASARGLASKDMMSWVQAGSDLTAGDYLLGSDAVARRAAQAAIADMEAQRSGEQAHCNPSHCDSDGHTVRWPNITYRWDWAARNESRYRARREYKRHVNAFTKYEAKQSKYLKGAGAAKNASRLVPWSMIFNHDPRYPRVPRFRHGYNRTAYFSVTLNATLPPSDKKSWVKTHDLPDFH